MLDKTEKIKTGVRAKVEHPFRVKKRQLGFIKVRYRGLKKNTAKPAQKVSENDEIPGDCS
jgi:IS5 family transposase